MADSVLFDGDTELDHYQVIDTIYEGRQARVLYSGQRHTAQSGVATDGNPDLLFDYNQRFVELLGTVPARRLLLIGGGAYTLPLALVNMYPEIQVDVIELDPGLKSLAEKYFGLTPSDRLNIVHADGSKYLGKNKDRYDVILLDAFSASTIPEAFQNKAFAAEVHRHLNENGVFAANIISPYYGANAKLIRTQLENYSEYFDTIEVYPAGRSLFSLWLPQNLVLVAQKGKVHELQLRYGRLPAVSSG
jgi:spermidine synthase